MIRPGVELKDPGTSVGSHITQLFTASTIYVGLLSFCVLLNEAVSIATTDRATRDRINPLPSLPVLSTKRCYVVVRASMSCLKKPRVNISLQRPSGFTKSLQANAMSVLPDTQDRFLSHPYDCHSTLHEVQNRSYAFKRTVTFLRNS